MEDPVREIVSVIHNLTQSPPSIQQQTIERYFTPDASFTHPFCRTGSFAQSRWLILQIYRWYKILSPRIELVVESVAVDQTPKLTAGNSFETAHTDSIFLYVGIRQKFKLWLVPRSTADARLVTVLELVQRPSTSFPSSHPRRVSTSTDETAVEIKDGRKENDVQDTRLWYIQAQNDLYQTSEFIKFFVPWGVGVTLIMLWQFFATALCVFGASILWPFTWLLENVLGGNTERVRSKEMLGRD